MEGLLIAKMIERLTTLLPAQNLGWVFPDETTAAVLIEPANENPINLVLSYRPPDPVLFFSEAKLEGPARSPFQRALEARARGTLKQTRQLKLDRVIRLEFAALAGFVETKAVHLIFELTGRNTNLLLVQPDESDGTQAWTGRIITAAREINSRHNRFRTVRSGSVYAPPPPYDKLDPRTDSETLFSALVGKAIKTWHSTLDGLGPNLERELARRAQLPLDEPLEGEKLHLALDTLETLIKHTGIKHGGIEHGGIENETIASTVDPSDLARQQNENRTLERLRKVVREPLEKQHLLLIRQLEDVTRARAAAKEAPVLREQADTLLAFAHEVVPGAKHVELPNLYGTGLYGTGTVTINLDPALDAMGNANRLYAQARRRETVAERLEERLGDLEARKISLEIALARLNEADISELEHLIETTGADKKDKPSVGLHYETQNGFEVLVGRNAKENVLLYRLARPDDLWFHVQGYPGSYVILRTGKRTVPFDDLLEGAALAAQHSKARSSTNVAVDYTLIKYVWRPKGGRAGQVYFTQHKTVFVDPATPKKAQSPKTQSRKPSP